MEITKDALLRVVKAARLSMKLAKDTQQMLFEKGSWTVSDEIAGQLASALFVVSCEKLDAGKDFNEDSMTMRLLKGELDDETVTDWFIMMEKIDKRLHSNEQPTPQIRSKEETADLYKKNGGYRCTPEGEWK